MTNKPPLFKGLNIRIPIIIPMKGRGFINQRSGSCANYRVLGKPSKRFLSRSPSDKEMHNYPKLPRGTPFGLGLSVFRVLGVAHGSIVETLGSLSCCPCMPRLQH